MGGLKVMSERCNQCLFGPDKIVSNERRAEILRDLRRRDSHFICHKASIAGVDIACRGDWDQNGCGQLGRIMGRLGGIEFVPEPNPA
ncbi:hypothetical protein [Methylobacterium sp. 1973]|uniref:hypothetical protein n=1 Tax=Methylobacterium sp. 1973 TaxID=3156421 RepID=UPI003396B295